MFVSTAGQHMNRIPKGCLEAFRAACDIATDSRKDSKLREKGSPKGILSTSSD